MAIYQGDKKIAENVTIVQGNANNNYSENEKVIGTWIDGKPIYRKVFTISQQNMTSTWKAVTGLDDVDYIDQIVYGVGIRMFDKGVAFGAFRVENNKLQMQSSGSYGIDGIILEYTKTE